MGVYGLPRHVAGRMLLVSCSAACFVIVSLFQASMVTKLSIETNEKDVNTFEELAQSGLEIRTSLRSIRDSLAMDIHTKPLADKIDLEKDRRDYVHTRFVFTARIMNLSHMKYSNYLAHFPNGTLKLHVVGVSEHDKTRFVKRPVSRSFTYLNDNSFFKKFF